MKYESRKTSDLIPHANNARTHSDEQISKLAGSIKEFGFINPVIIDDDNVIIAGHDRVMAAKKLRLDKVPVLRVRHLSKAQKRALYHRRYELSKDFTVNITLERKG